METLTYKLEDFEGPLDLLLHLISKNKLNIYDIPIYELVTQYLDYIDSIKRFDMDVASEFLDMAARLIYLKTVALTPKHEEETEVLKQELTGQLLEYQAIKDIAEKLKSMQDGLNTFSRNPEKIEADKTYKRIHEREEIFSAYFMAVGRGKRKLPPPETDFKGIVKKKIVSVTSKISTIMKSLTKKKSIKWNNLFDNAESKSDIVATFLAVLELVKVKKIRVEGSDDKTEIRAIEE
jgi:segregation and condensation protein A